MDIQPIAVALKFAFLAILFLYLFWIARSARKDLFVARSSSGHDRTIGASPGGNREAWLVVEEGGGLAPGTRFDLFGGATLGRSSDAEISFSDGYASGIHARVHPRGERFFVEDMSSTNGTLLNGAPVFGETELADGSRIRIGDTTFRFETGGRGS